MHLFSVITSFIMVLVVMTMAAPLEKRNRYSGDGTWFDVSLGSCGKYNNNNEMVAALNAPQMKNGPNPNNNNICNRRIKVTGPKGTVTVRIVDTCPECKHGSVDLSPSSFKKIADLSAGRVPITWHWV